MDNEITGKKCDKCQKSLKGADYKQGIGAFWSIKIFCLDCYKKRKKLYWIIMIITVIISILPFIYLFIVINKYL